MINQSLDPAPYNAVFRGGALAGVVDFDTISPGARVWDVAYAAYRFVPLSGNLAPPALTAVREQARRLDSFCSAYGLDSVDQHALVGIVARRVDALRERIVLSAAAGDPLGIMHLSRGDADLYRDDAAYVRLNGSELASAL